MNKARHIAALSGWVLALTLAHPPASAAPVLGQGTWETTLKARDISGHAVALNDTRAAFFYDTVTNLTWVANLQLSGLQQDWALANQWADGLLYGGYSDWRLPQVADSSRIGCESGPYFSGGNCGYNVLTEANGKYSEWAHLYFVTLGNTSYCDPVASTATTCTHVTGNDRPKNSGYFQLDPVFNLFDVRYWAQQEYPTGGRTTAWYFDMYDGSQGFAPKTDRSSIYFASAVREGDVLVQDPDQNSVPEPASGLLVLLALGLLAARFASWPNLRKRLLWLPLSLAAAGPALAQNDNKEFSGLGFGVGVSLGFTKSVITEAELDGNSIVRATKESKRSPRVILESHYFFRSADNSWFCPKGNICGHGPFVAIEPGGNNSNAISAYGLGWMVSYKFEKSSTDNSSWNIGLGYVARTGVRVLGDGLEVNKPLPANDKLRYKEVSQPGWMLLSSFSW